MSTIALHNAELRTALTGLGKVINRHPTLPALNHVRIERDRKTVVTQAPVAEPSGNGAAETGGSEAEQTLAASSRAAQGERSRINNGANGFTSAAPDNAAIELLLESALEEVVKQAQREHRVSLREFQTVRQTLRTLKSVRI